MVGAAVERRAYPKSVVDGAQEHNQREEEHGDDLQGKADVQLKSPKVVNSSTIVVSSCHTHLKSQALGLMDASDSARRRGREDCKSYYALQSASKRKALHDWPVVQLIMSALLIIASLPPSSLGDVPYTRNVLCSP